jgi:N-acetylglucosaminyldiphosphoundecaprenol N-acetyl-beta-D-mannosaminyltransferase
MVRASAPLSVFFFGGLAGVAQAACERINASATGLVCVGFESPGFGSIEEMSSEQIIARINASRPDFLVVSLGAKKGQAWIEHNRRRLSAPVLSHLGAVSNFVAGTVARAPSWMRRSGLEWLWRIKEEPALWRRYWNDGLGLLTLLTTRVLPYAWYLRHNHPDKAELAHASFDRSEAGGTVTVALRGGWTRRNIAPLRQCFARLAQEEKHVRLDMGDVTYVDSAFLGIVALLHGHQSRHGRPLQVAAATPPVRKVMKYCCAEYLCQAPPEAACAGRI